MSTSAARRARLIVTTVGFCRLGAVKMALTRRRRLASSSCSGNRPSSSLGMPTSSNWNTRASAFGPYQPVVGELIKPPYTLFEVRQGQWKSVRTLGGEGGN